MKVGDGYSTNDSCKVRTCVGSDCATPQTFVVSPSQNAVCTNQNTVTYDIGCNQNSPDYAKCVQWFYASSTQTLKVNSTVKNLSCTTITPLGALAPVRTCTIQLDSG